MIQATSIQRIIMIAEKDIPKGYLVDVDDGEMVALCLKVVAVEGDMVKVASMNASGSAYNMKDLMYVNLKHITEIYIA